MQRLDELLVAVVHPHDADGAKLARQLRRHGGRVEHLWPAPERLTEPVDLLFLVLDDETRPLAASLVESPRTAVIGLVGGPELRGGALPHALLFKPFELSAIAATVAVARGNFSYQRRLLGKVAKLEETLRSMRKVERAKAILMERRRIDEPTAYAFLRDQAMKKRVPIGVVASSVIDSNELLSTG
jgi:AmiR/NasT family two-component response regulator